MGVFRESSDETLNLAAFHSAALAFFGPLEQALLASGGPQLHLADADVAQQDCRPDS